MGYEAPVILDWRKKLPRGSQPVVYRAPGEIAYIGVHYDGAPPRPAPGYNILARQIDEANYHIHKNWNTNPKGSPIYGSGLMYHYIIGGDGTIAQTRDESEILWHICNGNRVCLAVKVDCGQGQEPTAEQLSSLNKMLTWLCYHRPDIPADRAHTYGHGECGGQYGGGPRWGNATDCPGRLLPYVRRWRAGSW